MRKIFLTFAIVLLCLTQTVWSQLTVTMSSSTVMPNGQAQVDVSVSGFTNILSAQFSMNYDSSVLQFVSFTNFSTALPGLNGSAVSGPNGVGVQNGQATFSWFDQQGTGKSLPNNTRLFTINFTAIGCPSSDVVTSNVPLQIEIVNANLMPLTLTNVKGTVTVQCTGPVNPCPNPTCNNPASLTFTGAIRDAKPGTNVCIPITLTNFNMMQSGQGVISWNPALLMFTEVKTFGLPGLDGSVNTNNAPTGQIIYVWSNPTPGTPLTLPANSVFMELCFNVVGPIGQTACIITGQGSPPTEWTNDNTEVPLCYSYGRVNIVDEAQPRVTIKAPMTEGCKDSLLCVDIRVDSFINITGMQFTIQWNTSVLQYVSTAMYDLEGLTAGAFNNTNDKLRVSWTSPGVTPITKPNDHKIFQICFRLIGACNGTSPLNFVDLTEFSSTGTSAIPHQTVAGSIRIKCDCAPTPPVCTLGSSTNPSCNGSTDGSINMTVTGADNNCDCIWKRADGTVVKNNKVTAGCNLTGVGAGTYTFELVCNGSVLCTSNAVTLTQPQILTIPTGGTVTNAACGTKGSITVNPTGGTPSYSYNWNPTQGNIPNPTNLDPGVYQLTVTDSKGCTATASFTVGDSVQDLNVNASKTDVNCRAGNNGTITLTLSGGCTPYSFIWSNGSTAQNQVNLTAGTYSVTVSDNDIPATTRTVSVTIIEPATSVAVQVTGTTEDTPPNSGTGSISILASGGTPDYTLNWSGSPTTIPSANTSGAFTAGNLRAGTYSVTVTDRNGCTAVQASIIVMAGDTMPTPRPPRINMPQVVTNFNGFSVPCNGNCNAVIAVTLTEGNLPITAVLRRAGANIQTLTLNALAEVRFTGICAGTYTIVFTNSVGSITSPAVTVTQPTRMTATTDLKCSEGDADNGRIQVNMNNTGVPPYNFNWIGLTDNSNIIDDLQVGTYSVSITDANDCVLLIGNLDINNCEDTENCFRAIPIITPNGDNRNDLFTINCARQNPGDLTIFDRFGRIVFTQSNYDNTWSGLDRNNNVLPEGAYMWVLDVNFGQGRREIFKGTVTILR